MARLCRSYGVLRTNPLKLKWTIFSRITIRSSKQRIHLHYVHHPQFQPVLPGPCCQELVEDPLAKLRMRWQYMQGLSTGLDLELDWT